LKRYFDVKLARDLAFSGTKLCSLTPARAHASTHTHTHTHALCICAFLIILTIPSAY